MGREIYSSLGPIASISRLCTNLYVLQVAHLETFEKVSTFDSNLLCMYFSHRHATSVKPKENPRRSFLSRDFLQSWYFVSFTVSIFSCFHELFVLTYLLKSNIQSECFLINGFIKVEMYLLLNKLQIKVFLFLLKSVSLLRFRP